MATGKNILEKIVDARGHIFGALAAAGTAVALEKSGLSSNVGYNFGDAARVLFDAGLAVVAYAVAWYSLGKKY